MRIKWERPIVLREHSLRVPGSTPGGYPGALPEATRDLSQGAVLEVLRTSGTAPRAVLEKSI